jgi:hypothetical protein
MDASPAVTVKVGLIRVGKEINTTRNRGVALLVKFLDKFHSIIFKDNKIIPY